MSKKEIDVKLNIGGGFPWVIVNPYKPYNKMDNILGKLIDARTQIKSEGYESELTLVLSREKFDKLNMILQERFKSGDHFKLNLHEVDVIPCIYGVTYNLKKEVCGIMVILLEGVFE
jgi:hypothetical protein